MSAQTVTGAPASTVANMRVTPGEPRDGGIMGGHFGRQLDAARQARGQQYKDVDANSSDHAGGKPGADAQPATAAPVEAVVEVAAGTPGCVDAAKDAAGDAGSATDKNTDATDSTPSDSVPQGVFAIFAPLLAGTTAAPVAAGAMKGSRTMNTPALAVGAAAGVIADTANAARASALLGLPGAATPTLAVGGAAGVVADAAKAAQASALSPLPDVGIQTLTLGGTAGVVAGAVQVTPQAQAPLTLPDVGTQTLAVGGTTGVVAGAVQVPPQAPLTLPDMDAGALAMGSAAGAAVNIANMSRAAALTLPDPGTQTLAVGNVTGAVADAADAARVSALLKTSDANTSPAAASVGLANNPIGLSVVLDTVQPRAADDVQATTVSPSGIGTAPLPPLAATGVPVVSLATPVGTPAFGQELGRQVTWLATQDLKQARIRLHPDELGQVDLKINVDHGRVDVAFTVQHPGAAQAVQQSLQQLGQMLAQQGLSLGHTDVAQHGSDGSSSHRPSANAAEVDDSGEFHAVTSTAAVRPSGLLDAFA